MTKLIFVLSVTLITLSILSCANSGPKTQNHNKSCGAYGNPWVLIWLLVFVWDFGLRHDFIFKLVNPVFLSKNKYDSHK